MVEAFAVIPDGPEGLRLVGDFDVAGVAAFDEAVDPVLASSPPRLTLDLAGVTFLASAGLACLLRTNSRHPNLELRSVPPSVLDLLAISGTRAAFTIVEQ